MKKTQANIITISLLILTIIFVLYQGTSELLGPGEVSKKLATLIESLLDNTQSGSYTSTGSIEFIIRKLAHFIEYSILTTMCYIMIGRTRLKLPIRVLICYVFLLAIAILDEYLIQAMTLGRSAQSFDVFIDLLGITIAIGIGIIHEIDRHWHKDKCYIDSKD